MKILLIVSCFKNYNSGKGGHYYSLRTTFEELKRNGKFVSIVNVGNKNISVLEGIDNYFFFGGNILKLFRFFFYRLDFDYIHFFDKPSAFWGFLVSLYFKKPIIGTKCGGAPVKKWYPFVGSLVLYTKEDMNYFESKSKFNRTNKFFIPNRVSVIHNDFDRLNALKEKISWSEDYKYFLRIARISLMNSHSIISTIELVKKLREENYPVKFIIIGVIEDVNLFNTLLNEYSSKELGDFVTNTEFVHNSNELIEIADFVIGSGRSLMEAAFFKKPIYYPSLESNFPNLLLESNFDSAFSKNFSVRSPRTQNESKVLYLTKKMLEDNLFYLKVSNFSSFVFEKYFDIRKINLRLMEVYRLSSPYSLNLDFVIGLFVYIYYLIKYNED